MNNYLFIIILILFYYYYYYYVKKSKQLDLNFYNVDEIDYKFRITDEKILLDVEINGQHDN